MENTNKSGGNFFSGFLLGALIGAAVVFLLGTKKGKRILKAISEEGSGNISKIINKLEKSVNLETESLDEEELPLIKASGSARPMTKPEIIEDKPRVRRFFRGVSRHVN